MSRIDDFIKKHKLKPSDCLYHTNRTIVGKTLSSKGSIRIVAPKSDGIARCEYLCPECKHKGYIEQKWKRPFSIKCENCGFLIRVPRMKDQFKREMKMENKGK